MVVIPNVLVSLSFSESLVDVVELVGTADVDLTVLVRDGKDDREHMYRRVLPGAVVHLLLELWLVLSIFCRMRVCNIQNHQ